MAETMRISGVVLAGGRSVRMGRDKALLPAPDAGGASARDVNADRSGAAGRMLGAVEARGRLMWERQRDVLWAAGVEEVFLSARPEQAWVRGALERRAFAGVLHDALPDCGPLVGITAALERATGTSGALGATHVAVIAIDLPRMDARWFATLRECCAPAMGAVGRRGGFFEPLAAIYPREMMWPAWEALARGQYALQELLRRVEGEKLIRAVEIGADAAGFFENWNTPQA